MSFTIKPATRTGVKPLVGFYGKSGSGKTMSALLFARGLAGPKGRVTLIDSESGRGAIFADLIPGGYGIIDLDAPFSPDRYEQAIAAAEAESEVVVVDSMSHEWAGEGGVLDMADAELERMGGGDNNKMRSWIKPKMAHKQMVMRLLRCRVALICCLRGEEKTHISKDGGKSKVITDDFSSPLYDPRFIFEMLLNFETVARDGVGGYVVPRKITHPDIAALLPVDGEQIGEKHGAALAQWCIGGVKLAAQPTAPSDEKKTAENDLWAAGKPVRGADWASFKVWMLENALIPDAQFSVKAASASDLRAISKAVRAKLTA